MVTQRLIFSVAVLASLAACTGKSSKRTVHEGPRQDMTVEHTRVTPAQALNQVTTAYGKRIDYTKRINAATTAKELIEIALELEKVALNVTVLSDEKLSGISEYSSVLSLFYRALDLAMDKDMKAVEATGMLKRFEAVALSHCTDANMNCIRLPRLNNDHLGSRIMMRVAGNLEASLIAARAARDGKRKASPDATAEIQQLEKTYFDIVVRYYRLLKISYAMSTSQANPELDQKYVNFARDYFEYFRSLSAENKQHEFHRRHRDTLALALQALRGGKSQGDGLNEPYCKFLSELNPLDNEQFASMDLDRRSQRTMVEEFVECASRKGKLSALISKFVDDEEARSRAQFAEDKDNPGARFKIGSGYAYALADLGDSKEFAANLNADLIERKDMAFFILDRVFYRKMDLNVAQNYWNRVGRIDDIEFMKFVRNYTRVQMAYVLKITMKNLGLIMKEQFAAKGGLSSDYFTDVVKEVNSTSQFDWDELRDRVAFVRELMLKIYDQRYSRSTPATLAEHKEYLNLRDELGTLSEQIAMSVTTPMTVPLYYYMAKAQGTIKIHLPWLRSSSQYVDITATQALSQFLRSDYTGTIPFFKFGSSMVQWDAIQKLQTIDYAFRIGAFEFIDYAMLDDDKASNEEPEVLFFKQAIKDILSNVDHTFRAEIEKLDQQERNHNFSEYFLGACEDPLNIPVTIKLNEFSMGTLLSDPAMTTATSAVYGSAQFVNYWRDSRENVTRLIKVMERHHDFDGKQAVTRFTDTKFAKLKDIREKVRNEIEKYNTLEREYFDRVLKLDKMIVNKERNCLRRLHQAEFLRRNRLMLGNIEYYKDVHAAMSVLNTLNGATLTEAGAIKAAFANSGLVADVIARGNRLIDVTSTTGLLEQMGLAGALNEILKVHNIDSEPYKNIGYFVTGIPTMAKERAVKSLNRFNATRFYQVKWDSLARTRSLMKTMTVGQGQGNNAIDGITYPDSAILGPDVNIPLGGFGELDLNTIYTDNKEKHVDYTPDQFKFLRSAMIQLGGMEPGGSQYISWYSTGGLDVSLMETRLGWLKKLQEFGVIETSDSDLSKCEKDIWGRTQPVRDVYGNWLPGVTKREECTAIRVSSSDVMQAYLDTVDLLRVTDVERDLLDILDRNDKMAPVIKRFFLYDKQLMTSKWTYFDQFYRKNYTTFTSKAADGSPELIEDIRGKREFRAFRDSYSRNIENKPAIFPLRNAPMQITRDLIREKIANHLDDIMTFEEAVYNLEQSRKDLGDFLIEKTTSPRSDEPPLAFGKWRVMKVEKRADGSPIYLKDRNSAKSWFEGFVETFIIKDADCRVLPAEGDPDWKEEYRSRKDLDCRSQYNLWKQDREQFRLKVRQDLLANGSGV